MCASVAPTLRLWAGWPTFSDFCVDHFQGGAPSLRFLQGWGGDAAYAILFVTQRAARSTHRRRHFRVPPFAKNAKDGAPSVLLMPGETENLGHPPGGLFWLTA